MEAMATTSYTFSQPLGKLDIITELSTEIKRPLLCHSRHVKRNYSTSLSRIFEQRNKIDAIQRVIAGYASNNGEFSDTVRECRVGIGYLLIVDFFFSECLFEKSPSHETL